MSASGHANATPGPAPRLPWYRQFARSFAFVRPDAPLTLLILVLTLTGAAVLAVEPLLLKYTFDGLVSEDPVKPLVWGVGLLLALGIAREVMQGVANALMWRIRLRVHHRMLEATVDRLHTLPVAFHRKSPVGATITRLDRGISGYLEAMSEFAFSTVPAIAYLALALVLMFQLDWRLSLLVLAFTPIPAILSAFAAGPQTRRQKLLIDGWASIYARFNEVLSGIVTVKSFAKEDAEKRRFLSGVADAQDVVARGVVFDTSIGAGKNLVALLARGAAIGFGGYLLLQGQVTLGTLVAFLGYIGGLFGPVQSITGVYETVRRGVVSLEEVYSILDTQDRLGDAPDAVDPGEIDGRVEFRDVAFTYGDGSEVLRGVDLSVEPGETVALVGPSGSGKSTLMALLQRLYDPSRGEVLIDGYDLRQLKQASVRRRIGVVLQESHLFDDTIRDIVAYAKPEATDAEVEAAARAANAHDFIARLPDGYATRVGERGSLLSGGERQRLAIARAILKDPRILVLDEATASLDAESEALVQEALGRLRRGRTTFVVAHRLSTVVNADRVVVLRDGVVSEVGTHAQLVARDGYYASLVRHQTAGLLDDLPRRSTTLTPSAV